MNLTTAVFLVEEKARAVRVEYDPDVTRNNNPSKLFKTVNPDLKKDDLVVVPTHTRHGFTVAKITDFCPNSSWRSPWLAARNAESLELNAATASALADAAGL